MAPAWGAAEADSSPVFYSSKLLHVTGMKISSGSSVFPVSAVAGVEILTKRTFSRVIDVLKVTFVGVLVIVFGASFGRWVGGGRQFVLLGVLTLVVACLGLLSMAFERIVHVQFTSGESLKVPVYNDGKAWAMHGAVEQALTYSLNRTAYPVSVADELGKLSELRTRGAISDADWSRARDLYLGKRPDGRDQAIRQLQQLHELHRAGVLSESEFNMKKWDILARS